MAHVLPPITHFRARYTRPESFPLGRTYYYLDWSRTTLKQLTPYIDAAQPKEERLRWHTDAMWFKRIHWPLTRDAWELEDHLRSAPQGDPTLPEHWQRFDHSSSPYPLYQSPIGHVFHLHTTYHPDESPPRILIPAPCGVPPPYPVQRDDGNILAGQLHHPFFCYLCNTTHPADNRTARHCHTLVQESFANKPGTSKTTSFEDLTQFLSDRVRWKSRQAPLTEEQLTAFTAFQHALKDYEVTRTVPDIPLQVFTTPGGLRAYRQQVLTLLEEDRINCARCQTRLETAIDQVATVIPPGVPVGPPLAVTLKPELRLTQETTDEILRIKTLLADHRCTIRYSHSIAILEFTKRRRRPSEKRPPTKPTRAQAIRYFWPLLEERFQSDMPSVRIVGTERHVNSVDRLGLDPAFWERVIFTSTVLKFRSRSIQLARQTPPQRPEPAPGHLLHQLSFLESTRIREEYRRDTT